LEILDDFRACHGFRHPLDNLFYGYIQRKSWKKGKTQKGLVNFLAKAQAEYLQTEDPLGMVGITHEDVAWALACQRTKIERFSHNLSIQLPSGRVTFANELIPGAKILKYKSLYALKKQLSENPMFRYLSDEERAEILQDEFHIPVKRRVVNNYMHMIEGSSEVFI
jgi:DNA-directed RNA polymerase specialized sigma54-like protein